MEEQIMRTELYLKTIGIKSKTDPSIPTATDRDKIISKLIAELSKLIKIDDMEQATHIICETIYDSISLSHLYGIPDKIIIAMNEVHKTKVREVEDFCVGVYKPKLSHILKRNFKMLKEDKDSDEYLNKLIRDTTAEYDKDWDKQIDMVVTKNLNVFDRMLAKLVDLLSVRLKKNVTISNERDAYCRRIAHIKVYDKEITIIDY